MGKFDSVDRLMEQAEAPRTGSAEVPLKSPPAPEPVPETQARPEPGIPGQFGRQLLGNLDPLMPVLGKALQAFPHSGVQAVGRGVQAAERFLPIFKMFAGNRARDIAAQAASPLPASGASPMTSPESSLETTLKTSLAKQSALEGEIQALRARSEAQEDQLRRTREGLERTVAEQGTLTHTVHRLQDRSRLLTAALLILLLLVIAQVVLLAIALRH